MKSKIINYDNHLLIEVYSNMVCTDCFFRNIYGCIVETDSSIMCSFTTIWKELKGFNKLEIL